MENEQLSLDKKIALNLPLNEEENKALIERVMAEDKKREAEKQQYLKDHPLPPPPKTWEEKIIDGDIECPPELKVVNGEIIYKTPEELYKDKIMSKEDYSEYMRNNRDMLLESTDKYLLNDYPITDDELEVVKSYRQYLRDIPQNDKFPDVEILSLDEWKNK